MAAALAATWMDASGAQPSADEPVDEILVVGERTGPRLWRVHRGEAELFVLATVPFAPEDFDWNDRIVRLLLEEADLVLLPATGGLGAENGPRLVGAMLRTFIFNRGRIFMDKDETLADKVGPELARDFDAARARVDARLERVKAKRKADEADGDFETVDASEIDAALADIEPGRAHPFIQAQELIGAAVESAELTGFEDAVVKRVETLSRKADARARPVFKIDLAFRDFKLVLKSMKDFSRETNVACVRAAVEFAEERLEPAYETAQAWARGDADALASAADEELVGPCLRAVSAELGGLKSFDGATLEEIDLSARWIEEIEPLLAKPGVRLALVSANAWLREGGIRDRLVEKGYTVDGP